MGGLRGTLFRKLLNHWPHGVESAVNSPCSAAYYERFADHADAVAQTAVYLVAGVPPDEHSEQLS